MTNSNKSLINIVLDRSGSMSSIRNDMISGFREFIQDQRKNANGREINVGLYRFDDIFEEVFAQKNLSDDRVFLNNENFVPRGGTALLDAVGKSINIVGERLAKMPENDRPERVLFFIITDGQENASKEFTRARIKEMIDQQEKKYNWRFIFLGSNIDSFAEAGSLGLQTNRVMNYASNAQGTSNVFRSMSKSLTSYYDGVATMDFCVNEEDREAVAKGDKSI